MDSVYINYWSYADPLCQSQSMPYLRGLARQGYKVGLITFEQEAHRLEDSERQRVQQDLEAEGILWQPLDYHKSPAVFSTLWDIERGSAFAARMAKKYDAAFIHGRSTVGAAVATLAAKRSGRRLFVDADGPLSLEYVEVGTWSKDGLPHRMVRFGEHYSARNADILAVLTDHRRRELQALTDKPIYVLPCAVDVARFDVPAAVREAKRSELGLKGDVYVYLGKPGGWYDTDSMMNYFAAVSAQNADAELLIITKTVPEWFEAACKDRGIRPTIVSAKPEEVPSLLAAADVALCFLSPLENNLSSSPIKFGEYLASGLPVVCSRGAGDYDALVEASNVGVVVPHGDQETVQQAIENMGTLRADPVLSTRCKQAATKHIGLHEVLLPRYFEIYESMLELCGRQPPKKRAPEHR